MNTSFDPDAAPRDIEPAVFVAANRRIGSAHVALEGGLEIHAQPVAGLDRGMLGLGRTREHDTYQNAQDGTHVRVNARGARFERVFKKRLRALTGAWTTQTRHT